MRGNSQVRFLGGGEVVIPPCYPAVIHSIFSTGIMLEGGGGDATSLAGTIRRDFMGPAVAVAWARR